MYIIPKLSLWGYAMTEKCNGYRVSGYWKGWPCGAVAKYKADDGKMYCGQHYAMVQEKLKAKKDQRGKP